MIKYDTMIIRGYDEKTKTQMSAKQFDDIILKAGNEGWEIKSSSLNMVYLQRENNI